MKSKLLLRIAAILMFLHTAGHTSGSLTWKNAPNSAIAGVITAMQTNRFDFMGRSVSIADFFEGYGIGNIWVLLLITVILWFLASDTENQFSVKYLTAIIIFLFFLAVTEYIYFFPFAAVITLLAGLFALFARIGIANKSNKSISAKLPAVDR
jgi:hypothetical protein